MTLFTVSYQMTSLSTDNGLGGQRERDTVFSPNAIRVVYRGVNSVRMSLLSPPVSLRHREDAEKHITSGGAKKGGHLCTGER